MTQTREWTALYRTGAIAALIAALVFRRNIGAEVSLFTGVEAIPTSAADWFNLLQTNPFVGMSFLAVFDLCNYLLEGLVFLALAAALWQTGKSRVVIALASGWVGITVSCATNISLTMFSLSQQYAAATSAVQKSDLLAAGQTLLATTAFPGGTGMYISLLLIALAGLLFSSLLLPTNRATAIVGLVASGCDLAYCLSIPWAATLPVYLFLVAAGLPWMTWHLLVARILLQPVKE